MAVLTHTLNHQEGIFNPFNPHPTKHILAPKNFTNSQQKLFSLLLETLEQFILIPGILPFKKATYKFNTEKYFPLIFGL